MNKVILIISIILAIAVGTPILMSGNAKEKYMAQFEHVPESYGIEFVHSSYEEGNFSSQAETRIVLGKAIPEMAGIDILATSTVYHGPVMFTDAGIKIGAAYVSTDYRIADAADDADQSLKQQIQEINATINQIVGENAFKTATLFNFDDTVSEDFSLNGFSIDKNGEKLEFGGIDGTISTDLEMTSGDAVVTIAPVTFNDGSSEVFRLEQSELTHTFETLNDYVALGQSKLTIPKIKAEGLTLESIEVSSDITQSETKKINAEQVIAFNKIVYPGLPLNSVVLEVEVLELPMDAFEAWADLSEQFSEAYQQELMDPYGTPSDPISEEQAIAAIEATLQEDLEFNVLLTINFAGTDFIADLDTAYKGLPDGKTIESLEGPEELLNAVDMAFMIEADQAAMMSSPLLMMVMGEVSALVDQGLLKSENGKFIFSAELKDGVLKVADQEIPTEAILGSFDDSSASEEYYY